MKSKYNGWCVKCKSKIHMGDDISKDTDLGKWTHTACPEHPWSKHERAPGPQGVPAAGPMGTITSAAAAFASITPVSVQDEQMASIDYRPFVPSVYQNNIFEFVTNDTRNGVIEAVAGSGKTTTITKALQLIPAQARAAFLAFNKHIVSELETRKAQGSLPGNVHISTIHSLGWSLIRECYGLSKDDIEKDKVGIIMELKWPVSKYRKCDDGKTDLLVKGHKQEIPFDERTSNRHKRELMRRLVMLAKATLTDWNNVVLVLEMCERYGVESEQPEELGECVQFLPAVMEACKKHDKIDFDDMAWLPVIDNRLRNHVKKFDFIFVDEGQDLNNCQIEFIMLSLAPGGRVIVVGDRRQSLYGFRGADVEAIPRMIKMLDAVVLPLSISYRCPKAAVELAKDIVPGIEYAENAIDGEVSNMPYKEFIETIQPGDMVICRTNAPLVKPAFAAIKSGKKAIIRGSEIGRAMIVFVERFQAVDLQQLEVMMSESVSKEAARLLDSGKELAAEMAMDKLDTILTISKECVTVPELIIRLETLFDDGNKGIVFSSVHRAKGLEATRVFILNRELMPHPKAKRDWEILQEMNALYVAETRTKDKLYFVDKEESRL